MTRALLLLALAGCVERQELREQHCAQLAIARHGVHRPDGVYGTWTRGARCNARLWNGRVVHEGKLSGNEWLVFDLGADTDKENGFRCLGTCHGRNLYDVRISSDQRFCYCRGDKVSD